MVSRLEWHAARQHIQNLWRRGDFPTSAAEIHQLHSSPWPEEAAVLSAQQHLLSRGIQDTAVRAEARDQLAAATTGRDTPVEALVVAAATLLELDEFELVKNLLRRIRPALGVEMKNLDPRYVATLLYIYGRMTALAGRDDAAADFYRMVLEADPDMTAASLELADVLRRGGELAEAREVLERAGRPADFAQEVDRLRAVIL